MIERAELVALLDEHAPFAPCAMVPALSAWHTDDEVPLWHALEVRAGAPVGVPYFAIAWPAAQVLARALLEGRVAARGRRVADVGCGSGLVACAAATAGAARVRAFDVDERAVCAAVELARRHGVVVQGAVRDPLAAPEELDDELIVCADLVSREAQRVPFAAAVRAWLARGAELVLVDSGRPFFESHGLPLAFAVEVPAGSRVDGTGPRTVRVFRSSPHVRSDGDAS